MPLCALPTVLSSWIEHLRCSLDRRLHDRFGSILFGLFFTRERRRTASSRFRAGEIGEDFRRAYETIGSVGRQAVPMATTMVHQVDHIQVVADGGYCKKPFLDAARRLGISVAGRLRCDSASCTLPEEQPASKRGRKPIYGKQRIELAKRAGQSGGWLEEEMAIYGEVKTKSSRKVQDLQNRKRTICATHVTEALLRLFGMAKFDPTRKYRIESKEKAIRLIEEPSQSDKGLRRVTIFDSDDRRESQIIGYEVEDVQTGKIHLKATIQKTSSSDPHISDAEKPSYPRKIRFEFPVNQCSATLAISESTINGSLSKDIFDLPKMPKTKAVNLADQPPK